MPIEIIVPRLGWSMEEGAFVAWLKKDGEFVRAGDPLFSLEGDKAIQEVESIDSGVLRIAANAPKPGDSIRVGDVLGHLLATSETAAIAAPEDSIRVVAPLAPAALAEIPDRAPTVSTGAASSVRPSTGPTISPRALRAAAELGVEWSSIPGSGRKGRIRERDIRAAADSGRTASPSARPTPAALAAAGQNSAVLVTGGCGFIGTWVLRDLISRGMMPVVLDVGGRPARWQRILGAAGAQVPLVRGSLLDRELLARVFEEHRIAQVIHLAALLTPDCQADPWEGCQVNVLGTVALFEQARLHAGQIKGFSYASSVAVFGDEPDHATGVTDSGGHPPTFYGVFKKSVELIAEQYWRHFKIASVGIRPQVAYGPERDLGLTAGPSLAARAAAHGDSFRISYTGRVGYDYVEDVARAFVRGALEMPPGAPVVDLPGEMAEVEEVITAIDAAVPGAFARLTASGPLIPAHAPPTPRLISTLFPDWKTTPLAEGIRRTVEFYRVQPLEESAVNTTKVAKPQR